MVSGSVLPKHHCFSSFLSPAAPTPIPLIYSSISLSVVQIHLIRICGVGVQQFVFSTLFRRTPRGMNLGTTGSFSIPGLPTWHPTQYTPSRGLCLVSASQPLLSYPLLRIFTPVSLGAPFELCTVSLSAILTGPGRALPPSQRVTKPAVLSQTCFQVSSIIQQATHISHALYL